MALSFAMCASLAFAQTPGTLSRHIPDGIQRSLNLSEMKNKPVDYKASIFSKDDDADTLHCFNFSTADMTGITYGTNAKITASMTINDTTVGNANAHTPNVANSYWWRYNDSASFASTLALNSPAFADWDSVNGGGAAFIMRYGMGLRYAGDNNGFMFFSMLDVNAQSGAINAYIGFPAKTKAHANSVIEIRMTQALYKFADRCYIDYKVNGNWYAREINVRGVDVSGSNVVAPIRPGYTMPIALANEANVEIRIRLYNLGTSQAYGYAWAVDNVAIVEHTAAERWNLVRTRAIDGIYGTIPQNMNIPITYGAQVQNQTNNPINNATLNISASSNGTTWTSVASSAPKTIAGGNVDTIWQLAVDERGFYIDTLDIRYHETAVVHNIYGQNGLPNGFQGRSLPTGTVGANYYAVDVTGGNALQTVYDTVLYTVSDLLEPNGANDTRIEGYRWAHDNGLIAGGSFFAPQYSDDGYLDGDDNHHTMAHYQMHVRYTTGSTIPEDFVFRGMEIIPSTTLTAENLSGVSITPFIFEEVLNNDGTFFSWEDVDCGIDGLSFTLSGAEANPTRGFILPGDDYNAVSFSFPTQPVLKPNTTYRFGYIINTTSNFAPAGTQYYYVDDTDTIRRLDRNAQTAPYYAQTEPGTPYDVLVFDPYVGNNGDWLLSINPYFNNWPMIRPIVGEYVDMPKNSIYIDCSDNTTDHSFHAEIANNAYCNESFETPVGAGRVIFIVPDGEHSVITSVKLNGQVLTESQQISATGVSMVSREYNVTDEVDGTVLLYRKYYIVNIANVEAAPTTYNISATTEYSDFVGIDPMAPETRLHLSPNPATSTVRMSLTGVTGTVDCSIIDMSGRVVYNAKVNAEVSNEINVSSIPAGAYFVRVTNDRFNKIEKLIIK